MSIHFQDRPVMGHSYLTQIKATPGCLKYKTADKQRNWLKFLLNHQQKKNQLETAFP